MLVLDLLHSSNKDPALTPSKGTNKKRVFVDEVYDDFTPDFALQGTFHASENNMEVPPSPSPTIDMFASYPSKSSKRSRQEEVVSSTCIPQRSPAADSKVLPCPVGLSTFDPHDVLSGRGGGTNQHEGNCYFRSLINKNREKYLRAKKNDKPFISLSIVSAIRQRNGRFLKKNEKCGLWFEIGDSAAREKTSQALRQRAPEYRRQMFEQDCEVVRQQQSPSGSTLTAAFSPSSPLTSHALSASSSATEHFVNLVSPIPSYNTPYTDDVLLQIYSASLRQAQLQEEAQKRALRIEQENAAAEEVLRLKQKLRTVKMLELMALMGNGGL